MHIVLSLLEFLQRLAALAPRLSFISFASMETSTQLQVLACEPGVHGAQSG
jgi:hypothetical protein